VLRDKAIIDRTALEVNRNLALQCLCKMAQRNIGIEISPTCILTLFLGVHLAQRFYEDSLQLFYKKQFTSILAQMIQLF
jgi:hypothetical protein